MEYLDYRNTGRPVHGAHWLRELPEVGGSVLDLAAEIEAVDREIKKLSELRKVLEDRAMKEALANWEKNEIEAVIPRNWVPFTSASQAQPGRRMKAPDYTGHGICTVVALQKRDGRRCIIFHGMSVPVVQAKEEKWLVDAGCE